MTLKKKLSKLLDKHAWEFTRVSGQTRARVWTLNDSHPRLATAVFYKSTDHRDYQRMSKRNFLFIFLSDGKTSPRQSQGNIETKNYGEDDDDDDEYTACACQRWLFVTIFMPLFVVLSVVGFIVVLLLMPCKYCYRCLGYFILHV